MKLTIASLTTISLLAGLAHAFPVPPPRIGKGGVVQGGEGGENARIRVRLAEAVPRATIAGFDLQIHEARQSPGAAPGRRLASAPDRSSEWELRCQDGRIRAVPTQGGRALDLREPVTVISSTGFLRLDRRPYREELEIRSVGSLCEVVNRVDIERYLDGLVNSEFNAAWSEEAIGAQVIAARTYALHQIQQAQADPDRHYDVDSTTRDQVYDGTTKEDFRATRVVDRTRGMVLTVADAAGAKPLKAFYHSTCGGVTELPENVWGGPFPGFKRQVRCPYCQGSPALRWRLELGARDIARAFGRGVASEPARSAVLRAWPRGWREAIREGRLLEIRSGSSVSEAGLERRVAQVVTVWGTSSGPSMVLQLPAVKLREWLGPAKFRSAAFQVLPRGGAAGPLSWLFEGRGNGHGVGMCQWGAKKMGERGFKSVAILRHYYPDAVLRKLW